MAAIKYIIGNERKEVVEKSGYKYSIFSEQYIHALNIINGYIENPIDDVLNIVSFCGERGEGKSSCMRTVLHILSEKYDRESEPYYFLKNNGFTTLLEHKFEIINLTDPSFFDKRHNIMEIILGQMYNSIHSLYENKGEDLDRNLINCVISSFDKVKECIYELGESSKGGPSPELNIDSLSSALKLQKETKELIRLYLRIFNKDKLVVPIDDIDLNIGEAYKMCEQIRKYLCTKDCIILFAVKVEQLQQAVTGAIVEQLSKPYKTVSDELKSEAFSMSKKYLDKMLPAPSRIHLPKIYDLCEQPLHIYDYKNREVYAKENVKDGVVELIFRKTRYLFYNTAGGVSPIVPNNLRELTQLLGLLMQMRDTDKYSYDKENPEQKANLNENKHQFKSYLFTEWIKCLSERNRTKVLSWIASDTSLVNKTACEIIKDNFGYLQKQDFSNEDDGEENNKGGNNPFDIISDSANFCYNVSIGDVFHLINMIESDSISVEQSNLLFFIKAYYSILLYERYDIVTENEGALYPELLSTSSNGIYRYDERFNYTNPLQRLVGGSYFSFYPSELLPRDKDTKATFDSCLIDVRESKKTKYYLKKIFREIRENKDSLGLLPGHEHDELIWKINLAEFLILTMTRSVTSAEKTSFSAFDSHYRTNVIPAFFSFFNKEKSFYVFDVMGPFACMTNPEFYYNRFEDLGKDWFNYAYGKSFSLLRQMISAAFKGREDREHLSDGRMMTSDKVLTSSPEDCMLKKREWLWMLQSDSIIRNSEVLAALFDNAKSRRFEKKDITGITKIEKLYVDIQNSEMKTHQIDEIEGSSYLIKFSFLSPIIKFLQVTNTNPKRKTILEDILASGIVNVPTSFETLAKFISDGLEIKGRKPLAQNIHKKIDSQPWLSSDNKSRLKGLIPIRKTGYPPEEVKKLLSPIWDEIKPDRT